MRTGRIAALCLGVLLTGAAAAADAPPTTRRVTSIFDFGLDEQPTSPADKAAPVTPPPTPRAEVPNPPSIPPAAPTKPVLPPKPVAPPASIAPPAAVAPPSKAIAQQPQPVAPPKPVTPPSPTPPAAVAQKPAPPPQSSQPPVSKAPEKPDLKASATGWHFDEGDVLTADQVVTFGLRGTEGKHFVVTGEIYPTTDHDGGVVFRLRRIDPLHDLSLTILGLHAKRIMIGGEKIKRFSDPFQFTGIAPEQWHSFRFEVAPEGITARFDDQGGAAKGEAETKGANAIFMRPGSKLRKLKVQIIEP